MNADQADPSRDDGLVKLAAQGDHLAFAELVRLHQPSVLSLAYRFLGNREEAEEAAQEVFLKLWQTAGRYKAQGQLAAYLRTMTVNVCLDLKRRPRLVVAMPEKYEAPSEADPSRDAIESERREALGGALQSLPPVQRMAIVLFHFEGLGVNEVADILDVSRKAAESLLGRGRAALRQRLAAVLSR
jgi:RNA polymerase sigma-70 factor (ECF subfamily)